MLLGKRPRPPMNRTTSMSEITFDLDTFDYETKPPSGPQINQYQRNPNLSTGLDGLDQRLISSMVSPRNDLGNNSTETCHFLRACSLCKRRLIPGRDIFMYRGDSAFCSLECRQLQMNQDERKDKCFMASKKEAFVSSTSTSGSQVPNNGETFAA